jgi:hypothetical protein
MFYCKVTYQGKIVQGYVWQMNCQNNHHAKAFVPYYLRGIL